MSFQSLLKPSGAALTALAVLSLALTGCAAGDIKEATSAAQAASTPSAASSQAPAEPESLRGKFVRVITGDTLELSPVSDKNGQPTGEPNVTVHILGIKAPALDACGGPEAAVELKRIINTAGFFRVKYDPQSGRVDSKGNTQGYLYSNDGAGVSNLIGPAMIQNGYAVAWYDDATEDRSIEMPKTAQKNKDHAVKSNIEAQKAAQTHKYGIWATCPATAG
jgi:endonuclease YncB( thermonuclease family)